MAAQTAFRNNMDSPEIRALCERVAKIRFYDIAALARDVKGGPIGIDINRAFAEKKNEAGGTKRAFAKWIMEQEWANPAAIERELPQYEVAARAYYQGKNASRGGATTGRAAQYTQEWTQQHQHNAYQQMQAAMEQAQREAGRNEDEAMRSLREEMLKQMEGEKKQDTSTNSVADALQRAAQEMREKQEQNKQQAQEEAKPEQDQQTSATLDAHIRKLAKEEACKEDDKVINACNETLQNIGEAFKGLEAKVDRLNAARPVVVTVKNKEVVATNELGPQHHSFLKLLKLAASRNLRNQAFNIWLTGPAGSGNTSAAENVAKALNTKFHFSGAVDNEFKLLGFIDAGGRCVRTAFREAYEHGGIFLLDEVDGCHPGALLALNAALANGTCDFPDANVRRHDDCVILAAANTWGQGATHEYVGRTKLDSASLDRFIMMPWDYDENLERQIAGNDAWVTTVQKIRKNIMDAGIKHIVSPRASYDGAALLADGHKEEDVLQLVVRKGLSDMQWATAMRGV